MSHCELKWEIPNNIFTSATYAYRQLPLRDKYLGMWNVGAILERDIANFKKLK